MSSAKPDPHQDHVFWLHHEHFNHDSEYSSGSGQISFKLHACYDVVAAPGWCMISPIQPWNEIWLIRAGQVEIEQMEKRSVVRAGEIAILVSGRSRLTFENRNSPLSLVGFSFAAQLWNSLDFLALLDPPIRLAPSSAMRERLANALENLISECRDPQAMSSLAAQSWAQLAFTEVMRAAFPEQNLDELWRAKVPAAISPDMVSTLSFIAANLDAPLQLETLARQAHLSTKHFARKFKTTINLAPMKYVRNARLQRAQNLLAASDDAIGQIAARCGFEDPAHFSRSFKEYSGSSPLEFRRQARTFSAKTPHANPNA